MVEGPSRTRPARIAISLSAPSKHGRDFDGQGVPPLVPAMPSPVILPAATIQDDFTTVLSEVHAGIIPSENVWLSCYKDGEPSVHGKIAVSLHEKDRDRVELVGTGGVDFTRTSQVSHSTFPRRKSLVDPRSIGSLFPLISDPCGLRFGSTSSGSPPVVWDLASIPWISSLRQRYMRIHHTRTRNV